MQTVSCKDAQFLKMDIEKDVCPFILFLLSVMILIIIQKKLLKILKLNFLHLC